MYAAVHPRFAVAGGRAGARRPSGRGEDQGRGDRGRLHPLPPRGRDPVQSRLRGPPVITLAREQSRALYPDSSGYIKRDGVRLYYEVYGSGEPTVFLLPTWSIIQSRHWKMQIPYLARHCRVLTLDGRGNGRSDRPAAGYDEREFAADALAVMNATATERAVLVSLSLGAQRGLILAAEHPDRGAGSVFIGPGAPL